MQGVGWCREDPEGGEAVTRVLMLSVSLWNALLARGSESLAKQAGLCLVPKGVSGSTGKYSTALVSALSWASAAALLSLTSAKLFCRSLQLVSNQTLAQRSCLMLLHPPTGSPSSSGAGPKHSVHFRESSYLL